MKMIKKLLNNNYVFSIITKISLVMIGLLTSIIINRVLGPSIKGQYSYLLTIVNTIVLIVNFGMYQSYTYYRKQLTNKNVKEIYYNIFYHQFIVYLFASLVFYVINNDVFFAVVLLVPLIVFNNQISFISMTENINLKNKISLLVQFFYSLMILSILFFNFESYEIIFVILCIKEIINILITKKVYEISFKLGNIDKEILSKSIRFGFYPMITLLLINMNYSIDVFILKIFVDFRDIGLYTTGVSLAQMVWLIPDAFKDVLFSKLSSIDYKKHFALSIKINIYISIIIIFIIILFGDKIIFMLYGTEFIDAYLVTVILFIGVIPMMLFKLLYPLFISIGKQKQSLYILVMSLLINIVANFIFIPQFGINGAALTSVMSYFICGILFISIYKLEYKYSLSDILFLTDYEKEIIKKYLLENSD